MNSVTASISFIFSPYITAKYSYSFVPFLNYIRMSLKPCSSFSLLIQNINRWYASEFPFINCLMHSESWTIYFKYCLYSEQMKHQKSRCVIVVSAALISVLYTLFLTFIAADFVTVKNNASVSPSCFWSNPSVCKSVFGTSSAKLSLLSSPMIRAVSP